MTTIEDDRPDDTLILPEGHSFSLGFLDASSLVNKDSQTETPATQGAYILKRRIGEGGQGEVWEAWQSSLRRDVAVKIHRRGSVDSFLHEAILTGELDHPNIVPVLDLGTLSESTGIRGEGAPVMAMKRIEGARWDKLIAEDYPGDANAFHEFLAKHLGILRNVCNAVAYAHSRGILHLDLKPSQVIAGSFGEVFLMDWGLAARIEPGNDAGRSLERITGPFGTPHYMAPEQALGDGKSVGIPTDTYLLGAMAYHITSGRPPHSGANEREIIQTALRNRIAPINTTVPNGLKIIIEKALSTKPSERFQTTEEFRLAIEGFLGRANHTREARQVLESCRETFAHVAPADYDELAELERKLDTAKAMAPDIAEIPTLRDEVLSAHGKLAISRGDLELARLIADRIDSSDTRGEVRNQAATALEDRHRRELQRRRARRAAFITLTVLIVVLLVSARLLYQAFATAETQRDFAEKALTQSRRELARSTVQTAAAHVENQRTAEARSALRQTPREWRGLEWGYLASAAMPETELLRPRTEQYGPLAASSDQSLIAGIRTDTRALTLIDRENDQSRELPGDWSALASGPGSTIIAGKLDGRIHSVGYAQIEWDIPCGSNSISHIAVTASGEVVAANATGQIWRIAPSGETAELYLETNATVSFLGTEGDAVVIGAASGELWHTTGLAAAPVKSAIFHAAPVMGAAWRPGSATPSSFVSWAYDPTVQQSIVDDTALYHELGNPDPRPIGSTRQLAVTAATWSPNGDRLVLAFADAWLAELNGDTLAEIRSTYHRSGIAKALYFDDDGRFLTSFTRNFVDSRRWEWIELQSSVAVDSRQIKDFVLLDDQMIVSGPDGGIRAWKNEGSEHSYVSRSGSNRILTLDHAATAPVLATGHQNGSLMIWDTTLSPARRLDEPWFEGEVREARISADGSCFIIALPNSAILYERAAEGYPTSIQWDFASEVSAVTIDESGKAYAVATEEGGVAFGTAFEAAPVPLDLGDENWTALEFLPGTSDIIAGSRSGEISVINPAEQQITQRLSGHSGAIRRIETYDNGRLLLTASEDETARLWDLETGELLNVYRGTHAGGITSAFLTPDGQRVVTASRDSGVRFFDRESALELLNLVHHEYGVLDMVPSSDPLHFFSTDQGMTFRVWRALPWNQGDEFFDTGTSIVRSTPSR